MLPSIGFGVLQFIAILGVCSGDTIRNEPRSLAMEKRQLPKATWGPYVDLGFTKSEFVKLSTIYTPGYPPANNKGTIFLWPGLWDRKNQNRADLVQTVTEYYGTARQLAATCSASAGEWCLRPFIVNYSRSRISQYPARGKAIHATDKILIEYTKAPGSTGAWTQKVTNLSKGQVLFNYVNGDRPANWMRLATEYQAGNTAGTADTQHYWNTTVTCLEPEPTLNRTFRVTGAIKATKPFTIDGGKSWTIESVAIPPKTPAAKVGYKGSEAAILAEE